MTIDPSCSFLRLYYPFSFSPKTFAGRVGAARTAAWAKRDGGSLPLWERDSFPKGDLLPSVRDFVNPPSEAEMAANPSSVGASGWLFRLQQNVTQSPDGLLLKDCRWSVMLPVGPLDFSLGGGVADAPSSSAPVELALFSSGWGCLCLHIGLATSNPADWFSALHHLRFPGLDLAGDVKRGARCKLKLEKTVGQGNLPQVQDYWPSNVPLVGKDRKSGSGMIGDVIHALLRTASLPGESIWAQDVFVPGRMLAFASLFVDGATEAEQPTALHLARGCYRMDQSTHPAPDELSWGHPSLQPYAHRQYFATTIESLTFVAFDAPHRSGSSAGADFFREEMPRHLAGDYSFIYLMALHQRFALVRFQAESARWHEDGLTEAEKVRRYNELQAHFQRFTARCHFLQLMQREHHHRIYAALLKTLQIQDLYAEVRDGLADLYRYYTQRQGERLRQLEEQNARQNAARAIRERRFQQLVGAFLFIVGMPGILTGVVGAFGGSKTLLNVVKQMRPAWQIDVTSEPLLHLTTGILHLAGILLGLLLFYFFRQWSRSRAAVELASQQQVVTGSS